jgi:hypothetical protein
VHLALLVVAVTGVVLLIAGRVVGGTPGRQAVSVGGALAVVAFLLTAVALLDG